MISRTSEILEIPDLNKYATKTLENDCFVDLEGGKHASYVFPDKNQKPLRMCRMPIFKQAVAIFLLLISGNVVNTWKFILKQLVASGSVTTSLYSLRLRLREYKLVITSPSATNC